MISSASLQVHVDAQSIWAIVRGSHKALDIFEDNLRLVISQELGRCSGGVQPWLRRVDSVQVLAGLLPWACCGRKVDVGIKAAFSDWPAVWDQDASGLALRLEELAAMGWRDYQLDAISAAIRAPLGRGILSVGTGGGKTRIAFGVAYVARGAWLHIVHGRDLVRQANSDFGSMYDALKLEQKIGMSIVSHGWWKAPVTDSKLVGVLVDEVHGVAASTRAQTIAAFRGPYRIGLSGTALDRTDDRNPVTIGLLGPPVADVSVGALTNEGFLTPGVVRLIDL